MTRAVLVCPGRGSYTERSLGSLPRRGEPGWDLVERAEALRREYDLASLVELDRAERFSPSRHLAPQNVSALIWLVSMVDAERARAEQRVVAVAGNSMGWYTALAVAGALGPEDGFRLVQEMALLQEETHAGGQVLYPLVGEDWRRDPERAAAVEDALATSEGRALWSIRLGGYAVLAGSEEGVAHLLERLPPVELGRTRYPFRLVKHGPYHTPLLAEVARKARTRLGELDFRAPHTTLVDGRGARHTPWSADPDELRAYTLGEQVTATYDLTRSVRVLLREEAPEHVVLPGPGNTLGGVTGQILVEEGWLGIRSRADFDRVQAERGVLVSMRR